MQDAQATVRTDDILSQADIILRPSQYFGALGSVGLSGEQRLMAGSAGLNAINVLQSWHGGGERAQTPQLCRSGTMGQYSRHQLSVFIR